MCGIRTNDGTWFTEYPVKEGNYLWIEQWSCGCPYRVGIAYVDNEGEIHWETGEPSYIDGQFIIDTWRKIELPNKEMEV